MSYVVEDELQDCAVPPPSLSWGERALVSVIFLGMVSWQNYIKNKNDRNSGIWQSGISKSLEEYIQRHVCFVNVQSSLHENVVFSVCVRMCNPAQKKYQVTF